MQEVGFKEAFWPLYGMDEAEPITFTNIALRASFALLAAGVSWLLYANAPEKGGAFSNLAQYRSTHSAFLGICLSDSVPEWNNACFVFVPSLLCLMSLSCFVHVWCS